MHAAGRSLTVEFSTSAAVVPYNQSLGSIPNAVDVGSMMPFKTAAVDI